MWLNKLTQLMKLSILLALSILLISCEAVTYYSQAVRGQLALNLGRENIQQLLEDKNLPHNLREKFIEVNKIREFAEIELGLPIGGNYATYVDLGREYVVWNVFAAPEFSTEPMNWCYPIAGCVSYRGYFSESSAMRFAEKLRGKGLDVYVAGISAYSTLGWFDDSVLNTVVDRSSDQLASLIFHELAHQVIYIPGDTDFNESFATAVEREGLRRWLQAKGQDNNLGVGEENLKRHKQFVELIISYRDQFDSLYEKDIADHLKREQKAEIQVSLRNEFSIMENKWGDYGRYDAWFSGDLNNAQLSTVVSYNTLVPFFTKILDESDDITMFYAEVEKLAELDEAERRERVKAN